MVLQVSRSLLQTEMSGSLSASTISWHNLVLLTPQEGPGKTIAECEMECFRRRGEAWAEVKLPSCCYLEPMTELQGLILPSGDTGAQNYFSLITHIN